MATRGPTGAELQQWSMIDLADHGHAGRGLNLGMAPQTEVHVRLDEHLRVDRAMDCVTHRATLTHGFVLEHKRTRLLAVTSGVALI